MSAGSPLEVRRRPRTTLAVWTVVMAAVVGLGFWFVTSPPALATTDEPVITSAPVGQDIYVAVVAGDPERTLQLAGVEVHVAAEAPVEVEPLLCRDGSPQVTSDPSAFCGQLLSPDGRSFGAGDTIVLRVHGEYAGTVAVDAVRLGYRDGIRWATQRAGAPAEITVLGR
jgi:hypothetical protein